MKRHAAVPLGSTAILALMVGFLSAKLDAQLLPKKFVPEGYGYSTSLYKVPYGVAIGPMAANSISGIGTVYIADPQNNRVVAFPPGSVASATNFSSLPCPICPGASSWLLSGPTYVAVAPNGNIWISDTLNDVVVEVDPTGKVVAFAGAGPNPSAYTVVCGGNCPSHPNSGQNAGQFYGPGPLAVDKLGNLYVADGAGDISFGQPVPFANIRIQKFSSNGTFLTAWGTYCNLNNPGSYYNGYFCSSWAPGARQLGDGQLNYVTGLAVDDSLNVYAADEGNNLVQKFTATGYFLLRWGGLPYGTGDGQFSQPGGIAVDFDQSVYVVDTSNHRIQQFDGNGNFLSKGGSKGSMNLDVQFNVPFGIATVPPLTAFTCLLAFDPAQSDCIHGLVVSDVGDKFAKVLAARNDQDKDGITDEIDSSPSAFSNDFSNASLRAGFGTSGSILNRGDQTFAIYGVLSPSPTDEIGIRTETFGGATPLTVRPCLAKITLSFPAGTGANFSCSQSTVSIGGDQGPVGFEFVGADGTVATATVGVGQSIWVNVSTSTITNANAPIVVIVGGKTVRLNAGQSVVVHTINVPICTLCKPLPPPPPPFKL